MSEIKKIVEKFMDVHDKILNIYNSSLSYSEKWLNITQIINDYESVFIEIYKIISDDYESMIMKYNILYNTTHSSLLDQLNQENNIPVKISIIISSLHKIIYNLMSKPDNYYFSLYGKNEMAIFTDDDSPTYYINMSSKKQQNIYFNAYILLYALESLYNDYFYLGVDFEYTNRKIQLAQLNFEHSVSLISIIMIVSPTELETNMTNNFINMIFCNTKIKKILHGSDSLDVPYIYTQLLQNDTQRILDFTKSLIDTRFLCEYYKLNRGDESDNKCSIYDQETNRSAVYYFNLITDSQQEKLAHVLETMPADIEWNIHRMPQAQILYAQYDVLFLKYFYYRIINYAIKNEKSKKQNTGEIIFNQDAVLYLYKNIIVELTQFSYLESRDITHLKNMCKSEVDPINIFFIKNKNGTTSKLDDIFKKLSNGLVTNNPLVVVDNLLKVNNLKASVTILIKRIIYGHVSYKCKIYKNKTSVWNERLDNNIIFDFFKKIELKSLYGFFKELDKIIAQKVNYICSL